MLFFFLLTNLSEVLAHQVSLPTDCLFDCLFVFLFVFLVCFYFLFEAWRFLLKTLFLFAFL